MLARTAARRILARSLVSPKQPSALAFISRGPVAFPLLRSFRPLSTVGTSPPPTPPTPPPAESIVSRLRTLFRTHGWSALTIYLILSLADFSLTFLFIWSVGADRVREAEDWVLDCLGWHRGDDAAALAEGREPAAPGRVERVLKSFNKSSKPSVAGEVVGDGAGGVAATGGSSSEGNAYSAMATTAVLAYAIHKTLLLPVRLGLTAAITPKVVRLLRSWG